MYRLHYIEKLRAPDNNSTLRFGGTIDKAAEEYLKTRDVSACWATFKEEWGKYESDAAMEYSPNDIDLELLDESDHQSITEAEPHKGEPDPVKTKERLARASWLSLRAKGKLMLKAFVAWVDENVDEVLSTQTKIELEDADGNKVTGLADFIIKVRGYDKPILVDLKTSARYYQRGSVAESEQLGLYYLYLKNTAYPDMERAAYLVLSKQIKKNRKKTCKKCGAVTTGREQTCAEGGKGKSRCNGEFSVDISPEAVVQYIHDEIPTEFIQATVDKFNICVESIKAGNFEPCWTSCDKQFGRPCVYKNYCLTGDTTGLKKKENL